MSGSGGKARGVAKNAFYGFSTWFLPLGLSFVATPIIVKSLGHSGYGVYALVLGVVGYSFNLNTGRAVTKFIAEYQRSRETGRINDVVATTLAINLVVGSLGALLLVAISGWLVRSVFRIDEANAPDAMHAFYAAAGIIFLTMQWQVFLAVLQGFQRYDLFSKLTNLSSIATIAGSVVLALAGYGLLALLLWNVGVLAFAWLLTFAVARNLLPPGSIAPIPKPETMRRIIGFSGGVIGYQIISNAVLLFERGWIIRKLGEESLTYYVVPMTLGIYIHGFVSSLLLVVFPLSSELGSDREKLKSLYLRSTKLVCFFIGFIAVTLIVESKLFMTLWMGPELAAQSAPVLVVHTLTFALAALLVVSWNMTEGLGYPSYNFGAYLVCFVIAIAGMLFLTAEYGIIGTAIARFSGFFVLTFSILYVERWFFGKIQGGFWAKTIGSVGLAAAAVAFVELAGLAYLPANWLSLVATVGVAGVIYCLVLFAVGFVGDDEIVLAGRILKKN
ncbi:MAG: oligosaccharide flippase family protein [Acidobacteria bacterium]|nr:oligosaccharide flippase family protein [Acidobacteriota bacterium]